MKIDRATANQVASSGSLLQQYNDERSRRRLSMFTQHILGFQNAAHHREWYGILENRLMMLPGGDWDSELVEAPVDHYNRLIALLAPRSHSKSTSFTVNYPLWRIGKDPNVRILIVSASGSQSTSFLREIKGHIERNADYKRVFGSLGPDNVNDAEKWTTTEIIVKRTNTKIKDPTVAATSTGGTVLSKRADLIICDDILDEKNTRTAEQRQKTKEWFDEVLMPVLEPNGQLIIVGTAWNLEDLYHQVMGQRIYDIRKRYKAVIDMEDHRVLWPGRWSFEALMQRKEQSGSVAFNKSYQNEAINAEDAVFKKQWIDIAKAAGRDRKFIQSLDYSRWDLGRMTISIGVDLAIKKTDGSDFTAMAVVGLLRDGRKLLLNLIREKMSPAEVRSTIVSLADRFNPDIVIVESNAYQESIKLDIADQTSIPIKAYNTGGEKFDEEVGINSLAVEFENEKWILPYSLESPSTQTLTDYLTGGMLDFPSGHTEDTLMAVWFANTGLRQLTSVSSTVNQAKASDVFGR